MPRFFKRFEVRITVIFGVFSILWIIFSDTLMGLIFGNNPALEDAISIFKGIVYVLIVTLGLYFLLSRELRKRRQIEQELQLERDISPVAILVFSTDGLITYANVQAEKILDKPRSAIVGQPYNASGWHATDFDGNPVDILSILQRLAQTRKTIYGVQHALEVVPGKRILLEINLAPIINGDNLITGVIATFNDVTVAKEQEKRVRENEERFRLLFNNNPLPMWVIEKETLTFLEVNEAAVISYGYEHGEFLTMKLMDILLSEDISRLLENIRKPRTTLQNLGEWRHVLKNGQQIDVEIIAHFIEYGGYPAVLVVAQDITERKQTEQALRDSEERFRLMFNNNPLPMWVFDTETLAFLEVNEAAIHYYGYRRDEFLAMKITEIRPPEDVPRLLRQLKQIHDTVENSGEWRHILKDGRMIDTQITSHSIESSGRPAVLVVAQDISQRKQSDQALRNSEASLRRAQAVAHLGHLTWDTQTNAVYASDELYHIMGIDRATFAGGLTEMVTNRIHPDDQRRVFQEIQDVLNGKKAGGMEYRVIWADNSVHHLWTETGDAIFDENGKLLQLSGIVQDITERKAAEKALTESEARYRMLIEQASDSIFIIDSQDQYIEVNTAACKLLGYTREEILQMRIPELVKISPTKPLRYAELMQGKTLFREREMIRKDGTLVSVEFSSKMLPDGNVQTIARDITERKRAEEELRLKSAALESAANGIAITDVNGVIQWVNPAFANLTGYDAEEAEGHNPRELVKSGVHNDVFYKEMWSTILSGKVWRGEIVNRRKNGSLYTEEMTITPVRNASGEISHFIAIKQDITERKLTEAAVHRLNTELEERVLERTTQLNHIKNRIESILNSTADSIIYSRIDGMIEQVNQAFTQTFGCQPDEIWLSPLTSLVIAEDVPIMERTFASAITSRQPQHVDVTASRKDGETFDAAVLLSPVFENGDHMVGIVASIHDITSRNQMLRHAMDLSELKSRYVSMAAHDLRNPMAIILSASETLEHYYDRMDAEKKLGKYQQIRTSIKIMTDILDDVLLMGQVESGKLVFRPAPLDIPEFCQNLISEMVEAAKTSIHVEFSSQGISPSVLMDAKLLRHILGNLLSNAIKYSPAGGRVYFTAKGAAEHITFTIQDHGIGIPQAEQVHLFETFHRAQNAKQIPGTGLGLAIVKQSVELHGGSMSFESAEGHGTTFSVCLPTSYP